ncbi:hypothetical protein [Methylobacterium gnaphalii]|uniref:Uncharacterized protein n=1 Tax=Methylobacterium gnaphalii TaxID=1010610 RepID=A0A512JRP7_9HYPH|nr:hypothetical protein [Methylobacterium gnaphalii]GEP12636.1 hypothetical protein MGN01_44810 [Methylobacterium gnaphalii]GJD71779.1 hypothetical protein MMMDOFMJ_4744 [Methylobacterium gnaphalii]GLS48930.1 hypothetical protein GCM10007885_17770 [Methylobacterium gnaphalii]
MRVVALERYREERENAAWQQYTHARTEAERACDIEWGRAAGRAWRDTFQTPEQNEREREFRRVVQLRHMGYLPPGELPR